ncbi:ribose-phosphate pyrophosphokinase [Ginsengibacter hankyongi]|uniref:ribose-phosphate diphosphokinase n=1 Tax=Ginsengibacter hankyongi TaxID=2607284 RepID=A0A5J5ID60_9BACT|nr:ribose-phosphate pyrophosphokinase [Ginsengibacter hankyongi]KAA9035663.1 ribose-phosphate pyrophosphokinase [Ginsengibacter hankyongi]
MKLFALNKTRSFGELVAKELNLSLSLYEEREFEDGEHKARPLENVRNQDVFVIHSLYSDGDQSVNDKLCRLLFFISALKDASAKKVTAIIPYLCYARKDRKTKSRDPVNTRYVARLLEASGADNIVTMDVHNLQAFQNSFRIPTENLEARKLFGVYLLPLVKDDSPVIMSPDFGGIKRAEQFQRTLTKQLNKELPVIFMEKYRSSGVVSGQRITGDVKDKAVIIIDDLISTGGTIARAADSCKKLGAKKVLALATHGLFTGTPDETLQKSPLDQILVTNTIPPFRLDNTRTKEKVTVLNAAPLFAETIKRMEEGGSVTELFDD